MKKIIIITFLFIGFSLTAQDIKFHVNPGFMLSQIHGDALGGYKKPGYSMGAGFLFKKSSTYEIDWSTRINEKGAREPQALYLIRLTYLETDIVFNYVHRQRITLGTGLSYGFMLAENANIGFEYGGYRRSDIAPLVKFGVRLSESVDVNVRMTNSILSIRRNCVNNTTPCWYNNSLLFELSVNI